MGSDVHAKRSAPAEIKPISKGGVVYDIHVEPGSNGYLFFIAATKGPGGTSVWKTKIFSKKFDKDLETDVQEMLLKSLEYIGSEIVAVDEHGQTYKLSPGSGELLSPKAAVIYSP